MDAETLVERVRAETETEYGRLGSEKLLLAATRATIEAETVAGVLLADLQSAADRLESWAASATDDACRGVLTDGADSVAALAARVADDWPAADNAVEGLLADVDEPDGDAARAGALLGMALVLDRLCLQAVSFHVNEADDAAADRVRDVRSEVETTRQAAAERLAAEGVDADAVVAGGVGVVEAAYAEYADRLAEMGFDPKPIC